MIHQSLALIREELNEFISARDPEDTTDKKVVLGNIALLESEDGSDLRDKVVISLVNIEEERTLKNVRAQQRNAFANTVDYRNPSASLNLYVLFSANFTAGQEPYQKALQRLSYIIEFFQGKHVFTVQNTSHTSIISPDDTSLNDLRMIFNIYTMTFEQLNHLWGALGGKQVPSVMYRVWLVRLKDERLRKSGALVEEVQSSEKIK